MGEQIKSEKISGYLEKKGKLRAENRVEQNKWMQAIMLALNQHPSPAKLTHFRYSLDDLVPPPEKTPEVSKEKRPLERQNTMPERLKTQNSKKKQIIKKLQKLGAQKYGGSLEVINCAASQGNSEAYSEDPNDGKDIEADNVSTPRSTNEVEYALAYAKDQEQSSAIEKNKDCMKENADKYKKVVRNDNSVENVQYDVVKDCDEQEDVLEREQNDASSRIYERISGESRESTKSCGMGNFMVDNENYSVPIKKSPSSVRETVIVDNEHYCTTSNKRRSLQRQYATEALEENEIYSEPKLTDSNENVNYQDVIQGKQCTNDNLEDNELYAEPKLIEQISTYESAEESEITNQREEKIDENEIYSEPKLLEPVEGTECSENNDIIQENVHYITIEENQYSPCKDSPSEASENEYECVKAFSDKQSIADEDRDNDEEMISPEMSEERKKKGKGILQNIIKKKKRGKKDKQPDNRVKKSSSFMKYVWKRKCKRHKEEEEKIYEEIDGEDSVKSQDDNNADNGLEMLFALQNILETKKTLLREQLSRSSQKMRAVETGDAENSQQEAQRTVVSHSVPDEECPKLPKKNHVSKNVSPYYDAPPNNHQVIIPVKLPNKAKLPNTKHQSLDEILYDLDRQQPERQSRNKVRELIEKFDDPKQESNEVVLRRIQRSESDVTPYRHSDELDKLLNDLRKVTIAPVMKPGVTSSLLTPKLGDEEWLLLLPVRKRRLSEPDYDVPRSHKSLLSMSSKDQSEKEITGTRFFGPVMDPADTNEEDHSSGSSVCSMTPDSLEPLMDVVERNQKPAEIPTSDVSYTSHTYFHSHHENIEEVLLKVASNDFKCHTFNCRKLHNNNNNNNPDPIVYAQPKSLRGVHHKMPENPQLIEELQAKIQDVYVDSLDQGAEISTAF